MPLPLVTRSSRGGLLGNSGLPYFALSDTALSLQATRNAALPRSAAIGVGKGSKSRCLSVGSAKFLVAEDHKYNLDMRITNEIVNQIMELGGRDDAMTVFLEPWAWEALQNENPPQLNAQAKPPIIFGLPIRVTTEADMPIQVVPGS